jgi:endo-1,3-1,4-beta-glycanase ExoK
MQDDIGSASKGFLPRGFCAAALVVLCALFAAPARADEAAGTSFLEDFDGFNPRLWGVSHGWSNGDWQNCTWDRGAVRVDGGTLRLLFAPGAGGPRAFTCGEIQSRARYGHGTYEARVRTPAGSGLNAAFFTYIGPTHGSPHDEIDVEVLTRDTGAVSFNTYVDAVPANGATVALDPPSDSRFVHYAFAWGDGGVRWFVDGVEVHRTAAGTPLPEAAQKIYASLWGSDTLTDWMGPFVAPAAPVAMDIDWIAFTAEGEGCRFPASVLCREVSQ